jgi:hypothetical protein
MNNFIYNRTLLLAVCCAVVVALLFLFTKPVCNAASAKRTTLNKIETAGSQLLWESLSHQFVPQVQY